MTAITISIEEYQRLTGITALNDEDYLILCGKAKGIIKEIDSPHFFTNRKTVVSCDFRVCPLMSVTKKGTLTSKTCEGCYSANILNVYKGTRAKLEAMPQPTEESLALFEDGLQCLKRHLPELIKLRFYSLSDFAPADMPFIYLAAKYFTVDIISKTLILPANEKYLIELFHAKNVWISLSFNQKVTKYLSRVETLLQEHNPSNTNMNYTMNYNEEDPTNPFFSRFGVLHFRNNDKRAATIKFNIPETRVCAVFSGGGTRVQAHGSCFSCNNCHLSYGDLQDGKQASLPSQMKGETMAKPKIKRTRKITKKGK